MKSINGLLMTLGVLLFLGCSSIGGTSTAGDNAYIRVGPNVLADAAKLEELKERRTVETMHRYIVHRFKKLRVRPTLKFDITMVAIRLRTSSFSGGADRIGVDVVVSENGKELKKFRSNITTTRSRSRAVERMSKGLAKRIYSEIKDL